MSEPRRFRVVIDFDAPGSAAAQTIARGAFIMLQSAVRNWGGIEDGEARLCGVVELGRDGSRLVVDDGT